MGLTEANQPQYQVRRFVYSVHRTPAVSPHPLPSLNWVYANGIGDIRIRPRVWVGAWRGDRRGPQCSVSLCATVYGTCWNSVLTSNERANSLPSARKQGSAEARKSNLCAPALNLGGRGGVSGAPHEPSMHGPGWHSSNGCAMPVVVVTVQFRCIDATSLRTCRKGVIDRPPLNREHHMNGH